MDIQPDAKDWTWVLQRACPECGLDTRQLRHDDVAGLLSDNVAGWELLLRRSTGLRARPAAGVWSPLEYACHVRDVLRLYDERLQLMLGHDNPVYPNWDQDETAVALRYAESDPHLVAAQIADAGATLAERFASLSDSDWTRVGRRSDGAHFTVESFARYLLHDLIHHAHDVMAAS